MYSSSDYTGTHPPIVWFSADGYIIYGRYLNSTSDGYSTSLDICGGHSHGTLGYHYHAQVISITVPSTSNGLTAGSTVLGFVAGPYQCKEFIKIYKINHKLNKNKRLDGWYQCYSKFLGRITTCNIKSNTLPSRVDYNYLMPSCSMKNFYAASGVTLSVNYSIPVVTTTTTTTVSTNNSLNSTNLIKSSSMTINLTKISSFFQILLISANL